MKKTYFIRVPVTILVESFIEIEATDQDDFKRKVSALNDDIIESDRDYEMHDTNEEIDSIVDHNIDEAQSLQLRYSLEDTVDDMDEYLITDK